MKNLTIIAFALLLGLECFSQGKPICSYNENGYSIIEAKKFALSNSELSMNYRKEILNIVNAGLLNAGENLVLDQRHIGWIFDHISDSPVFVSLSSFTNSCKVGNVIKFYDDKNFVGTVGEFNYGKCKLILYKTICLNLLKVSPTETGTKIQQEIPTNTNANTIVYVDGNNSNYSNYPNSGPRLCNPYQIESVGETYIREPSGVIYLGGNGGYSSCGGYSYGVGYSNGCNNNGYVYYGNNYNHGGYSNNHMHHQNGNCGSSHNYGHRNGNHSNGANGANGGNSNGSRR